MTSAKELREGIQDTLVANCAFVDTCDKKCLSSDRETCYGKQADHILAYLASKGLMVEVEGYKCPECGERVISLPEWIKEAHQWK